MPLQIRVEPYCYKQPGMIGGEAKDGSVFKIRGADAQYISGGLRMWMGSVSVRIRGDTEQLMEEAAEALVAANGLGPTRADQPFPALDTDCSDFDFAGS